MAERSYIIPADQQPTFWNIDAAVGLAIGSFFGPLGIVAGPIIGGFIGKGRMERELERGVPVDPPTFWNKGIAAGWVVGQLIALPIMAAIMATTGGIAAPLAVAVTGAIAGAIYGGFDRKETLSERYETAKAMHESSELQHNVSRSRERIQEEVITPEELKQLESQLKQSQQGNHAQRVSEQRTAQQQHELG